MEKTGTEAGRRSWRNLVTDIEWTDGNDICIMLAVFFVVSTFCLCLFGSHTFFYQENFSLFVFSDEYLKQFTVKPGGLLVFAGNFLTQGYFNYIIGAVIVSVLLTLLLLVFVEISKRLSSDGSYSLFLAIVPSCLLLLLHSGFVYQLHNDLGFILGTICFLISVISDKKQTRIFVLAFFPLFYYLTGAYSLIFLGMYILHNLVSGRIIYPILLMAVASGTFFLSGEVLFLQSPDDLLRYPLPLDKIYKHIIFFSLVCGYFVMFPVLVKMPGINKIKTGKVKTVSFSVAMIVLVITIIAFSILYKPEDAKLFRIEKMVTRQDWEGVIKHQENYQSSNLVVQYYYNLALSEKGLLCDRMFLGRQDFGTKALIIPWESQKGINNIFRGAYFFYSVGLVNEAHRWAFESMVVQGYRPENIKLLIKTNLISGHYKTAEKYIHVLRKTLNYRKLALKFEKMLFDPSLISSDPELGEKIRLQPKEDFTLAIKNPEINLAALLKTNPDNEKAFGYKMAWYLLGKNVRAVMREIKTWKELNYKQLPRHIGEAALVYYSFSGLVLEESGLRMSSETELRYLNYESATRPFSRDKLPDQKEIQKEYGNTYWYYLDFK